MKKNEKYWLAIVVVFGLAIFIKPIACALILGLLAIFFGINSIYFLKNIQRKGIEYKGNIIDYESDSDGCKTPLIEFTTPSGEFVKEKPHIYVSSDLSKIRTYKKFIDQSVSILYDPDDPKKFVIASEKKFNYLFLFMLILVGLFLIGLFLSSILGYIKLG
jgi:hypothetical protein